MRANHLITLVEEIIIALDQTLKHVQDKLLIVVDKYTEDACHRQEDSIPLQVTHFHLFNLISWHVYLKDCEQRADILFGCNLKNESQRIDDLISKLVALLRFSLRLCFLSILLWHWHVCFVLHDQSQELNDVSLDTLVEANGSEDILQESIFLESHWCVLQLVERNREVVFLQLIDDQIGEPVLLWL